MRKRVWNVAGFQHPAPDAAPGAIAPNPAARVLDGPRGSARRRQLAALGLLGASPAMRVRHLSLRDEPGRVIRQ